MVWNGIYAVMANFGYITKEEMTSGSTFKAKKKKKDYRSRTRKIPENSHSSPNLTTLVANPRTSTQTPQFVASILTLGLGGSFKCYMKKLRIF